MTFRGCAREPLRSARKARPTTWPDPAALDLSAGHEVRERLEGMLVEPVDVLTVYEAWFRPS